MHAILNAKIVECLISFEAATKKNRNEDVMDNKDKENAAQQKSQNKFNSTTHKEKTENQNQTHNVRKEGIAPINQKR